MECPNCEVEDPSILARHEYIIKYDKEQKKWVKEYGDVEYACGKCLERIDAHDIEDILRQVDEL